MSNYLSDKIRQKVVLRAKEQCEYCQFPTQLAYQPFSIDHIIPLSKEGKNILENLAYSCQNCNSHKYNKISGISPIDNKIAALFNPREQNWNDHFVWNENHSIIIGISLCGRATTHTLKMNETHYVDLRKLMFELGIYPPK